MQEIVPNLVSTIIPVRNRPGMVVESIESVLQQTHSSIEIIVVDDGSTDNTVDVIESYVRRLPGTVRLIRSSFSGRGPGPVREEGRKSARGEFIQYLDSDDLLLPKKFELQISALRNHPECDIAYGWSREFSTGESPKDTPYKWTGRKFDALFPALLVDRWWCTATPLYTRRIVDKIGAWPSFRWGQDWAYDAMAGGLGAKLTHVEAFVSDFRHHDGVRQTGTSEWDTVEKVTCYHQLQQCILEQSIKAGMEPGMPEMLHFSRVEFMIARALGALGACDLAKEAFDCSRYAAGVANSGSLQFRMFATLTTIFGWKLVGQVSKTRDLLKSRPGKHTMKWSWAK